MLRFIRITLLCERLVSKSKLLYLRPSPYVIIPDQASNLVVDLITQKAEHEVLDVDLIILNHRKALAHLADCTFCFEIECHGRKKVSGRGNSLQGKMPIGV